MTMTMTMTMYVDDDDDGDVAEFDIDDKDDACRQCGARGGASRQASNNLLIAINFTPATPQCTLQATLQGTVQLHTHCTLQVLREVHCTLCNAINCTVHTKSTLKHTTHLLIAINFTPVTPCCTLQATLQTLYKVHCNQLYTA